MTPASLSRQLELHRAQRIIANGMHNKFSEAWIELWLPPQLSSDLKVKGWLWQNCYPLMGQTCPALVQTTSALFCPAAELLYKAIISWGNKLSFGLDVSCKVGQREWKITRAREPFVGKLSLWLCPKFMSQFWKYHILTTEKIMKKI